MITKIILIVISLVCLVIPALRNPEHSDQGGLLWSQRRPPVKSHLPVAALSVVSMILGILVWSPFYYIGVVVLTIRAIIGNSISSSGPSDTMLPGLKRTGKLSDLIIVLSGMSLLLLFLLP